MRGVGEGSEEPEKEEFGEGLDGFREDAQERYPDQGPEDPQEGAGEKEESAHSKEKESGADDDKSGELGELRDEIADKYAEDAESA